MLEKRRSRRAQPEPDAQKLQLSGALCPFCDGRLYQRDGTATHTMAPRPRKRSFLERLVNPMLREPSKAQRRQCRMEGYERDDGAIVMRREGMRRAPFLPSMDPDRKAAT